MNRLSSVFSMLGMLAVALFLIAADHIDAPDVTNTTSDIADFYAFESEENGDNLVFVTTLQGLLSPAMTPMAAFDENVLIEVNIDNDGDNIEDLVIQMIPRDGKMYAFRPYAPESPGTTSTIKDDMEPMEVDITNYGESAKIGTKSGSKLFAGPRDDPFFFDLGAYTDVLAGNAPGFSDPGTDTFAGTNVLAVVIEVPKSTLGGSGTLNTWVETKKKQ
ncbi:MAG: DUF4331 family protein [Bacteroidota bacterium]